MRIIAEKTENHNIVKNRALRKALLARLLEQIKNNEISTLQQPGRATNPYVSPKDRSSNNYGYMTSSELGAGSPNIS